MLARRRCFSSTLVVLIFLLTAGPSAVASEDMRVTEIKETKNSEEGSPKGLEDMRISPVPKVQVGTGRKGTEEVYFPYRSSISPRLGFGTESKKLSKNEYHYLYGLLFQFPSDHAEHWEAGADVINDGKGVLSIGWKKRYRPTEAVRPYTKIGFAVRVDPSEQLTTFLRNENFQIRPATGFEYFLEHPSSIRLELETWISRSELGLHLCMGYSYAF